MADIIGTINGLVAETIPISTGAIYRDIDVDDDFMAITTIAEFNTWRQDPDNAAKNLGAINGGITAGGLAVTLGQLEIDGTEFMPVKGALAPESGNCVISTTFKNTSPAVLSSLSPTMRFIVPAGTTDNSILGRPGTAPILEDYGNFLFVVATVGLYPALMLFLYKDCLATMEDISTAAGPGGANYSVTIMATQEDVTDLSSMPVDIKWVYMDNAAKVAAAANIPARKIIT